MPSVVKGADVVKSLVNKGEGKVVPTFEGCTVKQRSSKAAVATGNGHSDG